MIFVSLLISLALTLIIELPLAHLFKIPIKRALSVNILTNPVVVLLFHWASFLSLPTLPIVVILEVCAIATEGYFYRGYHKRPFLVSVIMNVISYSVGFFGEWLMANGEW